MIQYFQLTPEILLEYIYEGDPKLNEDGIKGNKKDIYDDESATMLLKSNVFSSRYLCFKNETEGLDSFSNLVLPLNNTETQFVIAKSKYQNFFSKVNASNRFTSNAGTDYIYENTNYDEDIKNAGKSCDVKYDKCIIHFTSRNYFGNYDALIFQAYAYMNNKAKLYFASFLFKKTSNLELKAEHLLYNEKLYTTQIEFDIPSVFAIFNKDNKDFNIALSKALGQQQPDSDSDSDSEYLNVGLLPNTPIGINVYGVSGANIGADNYTRLKTFKINTISIPYIYNRLDEIHVDISEAIDGDYYYIEPKMSASYPSFVDYIESMGEDIRAYMVMHELYLREVWVDSDGHTHSEITHKEFHIIDITEYDEDSDIIQRFNAKIKYRPICTQGGANYVATIVDTIKIINTVDSSSYEVTGSIEILNPYKYGKKLKRLEIKNESRPVVNVYNKKVSKGTGSSAYGYSVGSGSSSGGSGSGSGGSGSGGSGGSGSGGSGSGSGSGGSGSGLGSGPISGSLSGSFTIPGSGSGGSGSGGSDSGGSGSGGSGSGSGSGSFTGKISGIGDISGNILGYISDDGTGVVTGTVTGTILGVGNISGTFSGTKSGSISGDITGYIPGSGNFEGTIVGYLADDGTGYITGSFAGPGSPSGSGSGAGLGTSSNNSSGNNVIVVNKGGGFGGFVVENMTQNIVSFIECTNVGVSIVELSPDDIN